MPVRGLGNLWYFTACGLSFVFCTNNVINKNQLTSMFIRIKNHKYHTKFWLDNWSHLQNSSAPTFLMAQATFETKLSCMIPQHLSFLVHSTHTYLPMKMEQTECSETLAYKFQTPGNYPEESIQQEESYKYIKVKVPRKRPWWSKGVRVG